MSVVSPVTYPGETAAYRSARNELLEAEMGLRSRIEEVARLRSRLPDGGLVSEAYGLTPAGSTVDRHAAGRGRADPAPVGLAELFDDGKDTLFVYGLMFHPDDDEACPMCTSLLDGLDGQAPYIEQRISLAVVAKAPAARLRRLARSREWSHLRLFSARGTTFNRDYHAEDEDGNQLPTFNVFRLTEHGVRHWYGSELFFAPRSEGMDARHADLFWPLWGILDLTPEGRGAFYPARVRPAEMKAGNRESALEPSSRRAP